MKSKIQSCKDEIKSVDAAIFTIQETHFQKKGKFKMEGYEIFEAIRNKKDGGTLIGIHKGLKPMLIQEYSDNFELLVVEISLSNRDIRVISGYGPQENWPEEERMQFFVTLEEEINKAEMLGKSIFLEMDANSKLGSEFIQNDPHSQSQNGRTLAGIIRRHEMVVVNGLRDKCTGLITRKRVTKDGTEESIIDFVIISNDLVDNMESLVIDDERKHVLTKYTKVKNGTKRTESDHNVLISKMKFKWMKKLKMKKIEILNLKNADCQREFKELTSNTDFLSSVFDSHSDLHAITKKFLKRLNGCLHNSFKKVKLSERHNHELEELFSRRKKLRMKTDEKSREELKKVESELASKCAQDNYEKIKEELDGINCEEGGVNSGKLWKLRKKLFPRSRDPPTAMMDSDGNLVTSEDRIQELALETYKKRLENRTIKENLSHIQTEKEELCSRRLEAAKRNRTALWTMDDLDAVLKYLKKNKSRDPLGYANEIFRPEVAGDDLKKATLSLMNRIKIEQIFPDALEYCDISSIWKLKGSRNDFEFYRGIFRVTIFRSILDRLIYNDEYTTIDANLSDSNVGARKGRNIRDNIFVMNAIINSVLKGNAEAIDVQVYDVEKCFDTLWLQECINDLYEAGLNNDKLPLLFLENQNAKVAVKTVQGISRRENIKNIVMQGSVWGSLFCTTTMDKLGQYAYEHPDLLYLYKGVVAVPPICMVDDVMSIQKCSESANINTTINAFMEMKKLTLSKKKCNRIHIGKGNEKCQELKIHETIMKNSEREKYLGDYIDKSGKIKATIDDRISKGWGILSEIKAIINEVPLGKYKVEIGLQLRQAMLVNGLLYNSEAWHSVNLNDLASLEKIDEALLRFLLNSHAKAPLESLYMESGAIPMRFIVASRRLNFLQTILKRDEEELTRRVFMAQLEDPLEGDFVELVKEDFREIDIPFDITFVESSGVEDYRRAIKNGIRKAALVHLKNKQKTHTKVKDIVYDKLEPQPYLRSPLFTNEENSLLFALRTRTARTFRGNFSNLYGGRVECPLKCWSLAMHEPPPKDSQEHILGCNMIQLEDTSIANDKIEYGDLFADVLRQKEAVTLYTMLIEERERILSSEEPNPPGDNLDPSNGRSCCYSSTLFTSQLACIDCITIGK